MIRAYDNSFLFWSRRSLGMFLDYSVNTLSYPIEKIWTLFLGTGVSKSFARGDSAVILGRSGIELVYDVLSESGENTSSERPERKIYDSRSAEYWTGWSLAYYQWWTSLGFGEIEEFISIAEIRDLYFPYHEMDISQFVDKMEEIRKERIKGTKLKRLRESLSISQKELSDLSEVPVRTIQQYEQRQKDINRASAETVLRLSRALCTTMEEILEK